MTLRQRILRLEPYLARYRVELAQAYAIPPLRQRVGLLKMHLAHYHANMTQLSTGNDS
ncbi:MAG: hypothetical protein ACXV8Q_03420 [Methylobacter sp.]